eukprot:CAMPEP_0182510840 /NCGR_PEP_ID=MMETSP1321-20130603/29450_1 /TAXON_ID=91990 /ORGANISM="Bolidomonas sp., Strain RCC1657" /LENGTH=73 /DNA_ID=CAMNT_0024717387 /DNA_START=68 /DNA_END=289 /DNA_ORIENTATION=-
MAYLNSRQSFTFLLLLLLILFAFMSSSSPTTLWMQWSVVVVLAFAALIFDVAFTDGKDFVFDPDADNWRRKTE